MPRLTCPICERLFDSEQSRALPFCSARCRQIDLRRWLSEEYSVPVEPDEDEWEEREAMGSSEDDWAGE